MNINEVNLLGHLGGDPEVRSMNNGGEVVTMSIATTEKWTEKGSGEKRERTEWHRVVIFNEALVKTAKSYLKKGSKLMVRGQLRTRKWQDQSGQDRYSTEVVLQGFDARLILLDGRQSDPGRHDYTGHDDGRGRSGAGAAAGASGSFNDLDDDVPF